MTEQTSRLAIILDSSGAKRNADTLATSLERLTEQGDKASGSTDELGFSFKRLAASAAGAMSIASVIKMADGWGQVAARMKNTLKSVEGDIKSYADIQERLLVISNRNGKNIEDSQLLYIGAATSMQELGYNTTQTIDYIESLSSSMTANASSANEVLSMQNALNKSMVAGKVAGENWNSIMNATPTLLGDIAKQLEKQNGGIKVTEMEVKKLAADGKISFKLFADAVMAAKDANNALADSMDNTVADGFTRVSNSVKAYYGEMNQSLGITRSMSAALATISDNFGEVSTVLTSLAGIGVARYFGNLSSSMYTAGKQSVINASNSRKEAAETVRLSQAIITKTQAEQASLTSQQRSLAAQVKLATSTAQMSTLKNQMAANSARLTMLTEAETLAVNNLTAAQARLNTATNLVRSGLALVGGPVGFAMIAAGSMYAYSESQRMAAEKTRETADSIEMLIAKMSKLSAAQLRKESEEMKKTFPQLKKDIKEIQDELERVNESLEYQEKIDEKYKGKYRKGREALEAINALTSKRNILLGELEEKENRLSKAINGAELLMAKANGTLLQGADLLARHQSVLPNFGAAWKSVGIDIGAAANALGKFNSEYLKIKFTDGGLKLKEQLERDIKLAKLTGEAKARLQAEYMAKDAGETDAKAIGKIQDLAAEKYKEEERQRKLLKSSNATYSESAAQKMLSSLKEQQMVLIQQRDTNSSLGSQQQALVKWEQQLAYIKSKKTLTADQKSLLANAELITLEMKRNAEIEKTIQRKEAEVKITAFHKQQMDESLQTLRQYNQTLAMAGMGSLAQGRMQERFRIEEEYMKKKDTLTAQFNDKSSGMTKEMYEKETQFISDELQKRLSMLEGFHNQQDIMRGNWTLGVNMALQNYMDNARNYSQQAEGFITNSLQNITDGAANALTDITTNSKNALEAIGYFFGDMTKSVIKDLIRIFIQAQITNAMTGLFGGGIMGSSQVKTFNAGLNGLNLTGMAHSGIDRVPKTGTWLLEEGERVMTQDTSARLDNVLDALTRSTSPDVFAMKYLHPASQTNNTTNNSSVNNATETNENSQSTVTIHQTIEQTISVNGNGDKALIKALQQAASVGAKRGADEAVARIQRDFATNGNTRKLLEK
ncbi:tape measure protein [Providencia rettgeri]|uniref:tape measure protein n=1 Tax=Providencia rettgeri TaxID=587 RepID=UPI001B36294F|nr:tape measure protein [Providencia rettgeri]MBQ0210127.1 tape measure protein [Providencia rettgeri]MDR9615310.1 tape measure protein [Providencia rettgeri]